MALTPHRTPLAAPEEIAPTAELLALVRRALALDDLSPAARAVEERAILVRLKAIEAASVSPVGRQSC